MSEGTFTHVAAKIIDSAHGLVFISLMRNARKKAFITYVGNQCQDQIAHPYSGIKFSFCRFITLIEST